MLLLLLSAGALIFARRNSTEFLNLYKIEINRVEHELKDGAADIDLYKYETITGVYPLAGGESAEFFDSNNNYHIAEINGELYRIEYEIDLTRERSNIFKSALIIVAAAFGAIILFLIYIYMTIIRTFNKIADYPTQLSKGNLSVPVTEEKSKYFGKFLWGLDMLREKLEEEKARNLELQKEKNVFLLSLSHDMKTPISAIRLYAAALKKNLYKDEEKIREVGKKVENNADEIEEYVSRIVSSSNDDFLDLTVDESEFYLADAVDTIKEYYLDKLKPLGTELSIDKYSNIMVRGDKDRFIEVLQNVFENAIKYGDGEYIRVSFGDEEDARLVTVTNSGCTLKEAEAEHIFESFYRGSNVGSRPGSGLGLYICRKLMQKMGGEIFSESGNGEMSITMVLHKVC